jgi:transposase
MCPAIDNPASCEIRPVIRFVHVKNTIATEIHLGLCAVYGQVTMSEATVRQWWRMFKDGRTNVQDEERSGRPSVVSDDLFKMLTKKFVKDGASQFQNFRVHLHKFRQLFPTRLSQLG